MGILKGPSGEQPSQKQEQEPEPSQEQQEQQWRMVCFQGGREMAANTTRRPGGAEG